MAVYRVDFAGGELTDAAQAALTAAGAWWEGSESGPARPDRHRVLVEASSEEQAMASVRGMLTLHGSFDQYGASPVREAHGEVWRGPFYRKWHEIDWRTPERASLNELQRAVLGALMNDHEPTWTVVRDPKVNGDRPQIEAALEELGQAGLVDRRMAASGEPGREADIETWWAITNEGWDLLGFIKSPNYR